MNIKKDALDDREFIVRFCEIFMYLCKEAFVTGITSILLLFRLLGISEC